MPDTAPTVDRILVTQPREQCWAELDGVLWNVHAYPIGKDGQLCFAPAFDRDHWECEMRWRAGDDGPRDPDEAERVAMLEVLADEGWTGRRNWHGIPCGKCGGDGSAQDEADEFVCRVCCGGGIKVDEHGPQG